MLLHLFELSCSSVARLRPIMTLDTMFLKPHQHDDIYCMGVHEEDKFDGDADTDGDDDEHGGWRCF